MKLPSPFSTRRKPVLLMCILGLSIHLAPLAHAQQNGSGDFNVTGSLDVYGNTLNLGSWTDDGTKLGLNIFYAEDAGHAATLTLTATRSVSGWWWKQAAPSGGTGSVPQMSLSPANALTLYNLAAPTPAAAIVLDPVGTSTFGTSTAFNGASNVMPNQTITGNSSILTVSLADARYLVQNNGASLVVGAGSTAGGANAMAMGFHATASGSNSTALGDFTTATQLGATALGLSARATGGYSSALGYASAAEGEWSTAVGVAADAPALYAVSLGVFSQAIGIFSTALGTQSTASGDFATALGNEVTASGYSAVGLGRHSFATNSYSTVVGEYATASGYESSVFGSMSLASGTQSTALGFQSGAGGTASVALGLNSAASGNYGVALGSFSSASGSYSTALTSSASAVGDYSVAAGRTQATSIYQFVTGAYAVPRGNAHAWVPTDDLFTVGNGQSASAPHDAFNVKKNGNTFIHGGLYVNDKMRVDKNGDTSVDGSLTVAKAIVITQPQGDLSMGEFTAHPNPSPSPSPTP